MLSVDVDIRSVKVLHQQLSAINKSLANKTLRKALTAMGKVFRDGLKMELPKRTGLLRRSLAYRVWKNKSNRQMMAKIGAKNVRGAALFRTKTKRGKVRIKVATTDKQRNRLKLVDEAEHIGAANPAVYLHLVDGGAKPHAIKTPWPYGNRNASVKHPGVKGGRYIEKTARRHKEAALAEAVRVMEQEIEAAKATGVGE